MYRLKYCDGDKIDEGNSQMNMSIKTKYISNIQNNNILVLNILLYNRLHSIIMFSLIVLILIVFGLFSVTELRKLSHIYGNSHPKATLPKRLFHDRHIDVQATLTYIVFFPPFCIRCMRTTRL